VQTSFSQYDGPRLLHPEEMYASEYLSHLCFDEVEIPPDYPPPRYIQPRRGGTYVLAHQGKLVSQISVFHDLVQMYAGVIHTASIGGVCTHPDFRNQGLASHLLEYCTQDLVRQGASLMLISGDAGVYIRLGNVPHGRYFTVSMQPGGERRQAPAGISLRRLTPADSLTLSRLYQAEPVHYRRLNRLFAHALQNPQADSFIHAEGWLAERSGQAAAYLFLGCPYEEEMELGNRHVSEYAGSRLAIAAALDVLLASGTLKNLAWAIPWQDAELIHLLQEGGYSGSMAPLEGHTLRIVDFPRLMHGLRPILQARLGAKLLRGLRFEQSGARLGSTGTDRCTIVRGADRLELDGAAMTRLVIGTTENVPQPVLPGALAEIIPALFPLPAFLPGLNYR
jgi:predicted acetyltransferase